MAHFAEIDEDYTVVRVVKVSDEHEAQGAQWCEDFFGGGTWLQTSFNGTIRKNFAGKGFTYDLILDAFIPPKPYQSWVLNEETAQWESPVPYPDDGNGHKWDEEETAWILIPPPE
ncbi:hypothetical protein RYZ26_15245 [Terasakiella sp. A23]|uniref:hypothetical protein n=1 Tax=Terasakiella sp. FCG-A23 TaxID=3080561 RepID=UPI002953ECC6|nr:hypothetical protein [Terasakiella sp. A23]MDV7340960.1 hypothetical protein [Terasakiella sp. A23]